MKVVDVRLILFENLFHLCIISWSSFLVSHGIMLNSCSIPFFRMEATNSFLKEILDVEQGRSPCMT